MKRERGIRDKGPHMLLFLASTRFRNVNVNKFNLSDSFNSNLFLQLRREGKNGKFTKMLKEI